jgi:hypothetical protein
MALGWILNDHGETSVKFLKRNLNFIKFYLTRAKIKIPWS